MFNEFDIRSYYEIQGMQIHIYTLISVVLSLSNLVHQWTPFRVKCIWSHNSYGIVQTCPTGFGRNREGIH